MAVLAMITVFSRFVRLLVHAQALDQPNSVNTLLTVQDTMLGINKWVNLFIGSKSRLSTITSFAGDLFFVQFSLIYG
jgi:hypothetical protein